ncbi:MAG: crossover junction endodeoxyribonuclease RuvC [Candidatus Omnitrophica bacterium]|nr:crossover junction endodeoxyribonuclease RuvC [Candidatus Omnitrophota bacterium]
MKILGVDPGLRITGYGVVSVPDGFSFHRSIDLIEAGVIRTETRMGIAARLRRLHDGLSEVISEFKPDILAIEKLYTHYKHPTTAILMGHARGVVCLLSGTSSIPLVSVASTHVKKAVTGRGHASKLQIQRMVQHYLGLKKPLEPFDMADALAVAIAHAFSLKRKERD